MIRGIAFDKDGTLLEFSPFWISVAQKGISYLLDKHNCFNENILDEMLNAIGAYDGINGLLCYGSYKDICKKINEVQTRYNSNILFTYEEVLDSFNKNAKYGEVVSTCSDIIEFMRRLKKKQINVAVITTDNYEIADYTLKKLGIREFVDKIYSDDGVNPTKPDPYYMNCFMNDFSLDRTEVCMVGDTLTDVRFAENSGVKMIGVAKDESAKIKLLSENDIVIPDISHILEVIDING